VASRRALLDAVRGLLAERPWDPRVPEEPFELPRLAERAGVSVATAYRHFADAEAAREACHRELVEALFEEIGTETGPESGTARERYHRACALWVGRAAEYAPAAVRPRDRYGLLARLAAGDVLAALVRDRLGALITALAAEGELPPSVPVDYAVLLWCTLFDERLLCDLLLTEGWSDRRVTDHLSTALLAALRSTPD
jgi:AcrR family transcriptional regulator